MKKGKSVVKKGKGVVKKGKGVFISQTQGKSLAVATALHAWLRDDMKLGDPWLAPEKNDVGDEWKKKLEKALDEACCGIFCITADNLKNEWISYEAGRLRQNDKIFPYVIDSSVSLDELPAPIKDLQAQRSDRKGTEALVVAINKALDRSLRLRDLILRVRFNSTWWKLKNKLDKINPPPLTAEEYEEIIEEFINLFTKIKDYKESIETEIPSMVDKAISLYNQGKYASDAFANYIYRRIEEKRGSSNWGHSVIGNVRDFFTEQFTESDLRRRLENLEPILRAPQTEPETKRNLLLKHARVEELDIYLSYYQKLIDTFRNELNNLREQIYRKPAPRNHT